MHRHNGGIYYHIAVEFIGASWEAHPRNSRFFRPNPVTGTLPNCNGSSRDLDLCEVASTIACLCCHVFYVLFDTTRASVGGIKRLGMARYTIVLGIQL